MDTVNSSPIPIPLSQALAGQIADQTELSVDTRELIAPPRPIWWVFLLGFCSLGFYYCFWLVGRARDVKVLQSEKTTPAWWFFVPLVAIAQLIALPKLAARWDRVSRERNLPSSKLETWIPLAALLVFACSAYANLSYRYDWPLKWDALGSFLTAAAMMVFHLRYNSLAQQLSEQVSFKSVPRTQLGFEVLAVLAGIALWGLLLYDYIEKESEVQGSLGSSYTFSDKDLGIELDLQGDEWLSVEIGSYSDGTAAVEFRNRAATAAIIIFKQNSENKTLSSMADYRFEEAEQSHSANLLCRENRNQYELDSHLRAFLWCESESLGDKTYDLQASIQLDEHLVEVLGMVSGSEATVKEAYQATFDTLSSLRGIQ